MYAKILECKFRICVEDLHAVDEKAAGRGPLGLTEGRGGMADTAGLEWVFTSTGEPGMARTFFSPLSEEKKKKKKTTDKYFFLCKSQIFLCCIKYALEANVFSTLNKEECDR